MFKQSLSTLFLCICFGAVSCTGKSSGFDGLAAPDASADKLGDGSGAVPGGSNPGGNPGGGQPGGGQPGGNGGPNGDVTSDYSGANPFGGGVPVEPGPGGPPEPVPEPMTMLLFGSGLAGIAYRYRRRNEDDVEGEQQEARTAEL